MNESSVGNPLVSIGIPMFNASRYLEETLVSILEQTYGDLEIIVRDNASSDDSVDIVKMFARRDRRIMLLESKVNEGAASNYNAVFKSCNGKYFKWAAADDLLAPTFVQDCVAALEKDPRAVLAYPETMIIDKDGRHVNEIGDPLRATPDDRIERFKSVTRLTGECNAIFGVIRQEVLARTQLIQPFESADAHLLAELALHGQFVRREKVLFYRRDHDEASSADRSEKGQAGFYDPGLLGRPLMSIWRGFRYDLHAVRAAPATLLEKVRIYGFLLRKALWNRRQLFREFRQFVRFLLHRKKA